MPGLRQVEITRLDVKDIDLIRKTALIEGEGEDGKEMIYLHPEIARHIKEYLKKIMSSKSTHIKKLTLRKFNGKLCKTILKETKEGAEG